MIPAEAVETAAKVHAQMRQRQSHILSIVCYVISLTFGVAGFVLADGRSWTPMLLGAGCFIFAILTFLAGRASIRWGKVAKART